MAFVAEPVMRRGPGNDLLTRGICFGDVFHVRHAVTGAYLAMAPTVAPVKGPGGVDRRDALLFDDDDGPDSVDDARALLAFKLLPAGRALPPLGTPVLDGMACLVASAARPCACADADATSKAVLAVLGRAILDNRECEAHFGVGSVLIRQGEALRALQVHLSWNADSKEYRVEAVDELFYDAYSPKLFFRDGLKEVLWPGAPRHAEARPAIEVYALGSSSSPREEGDGPGRRAEDRDSAERLLNQLQIGRYFEAQLKLLGDLCAGRSAQNILKLQARGGFSYETLVAVFRGSVAPGQHKGDSTSLQRGAVPAFGDAEPAQQPLPGPLAPRARRGALLWVLEDVESRRLSPALQRARCPATPIAEPVRDGFAALRRELSRHLATSATLNPENVASNDLTAKVVDIASTLFDFGLFTVGTVDDTIDLARRLVDLANPAIDAPAVDKSHLKPVARARRALRASRRSTATMHWRIERILSYLFEEMGDRTFDVHKFPTAADYDGGSGASTIDMVVATSPPPSWLPDWFLDRTNRPSHEAPLGPNAHHQSICFSLGLIDILILALKMGRSLIKTTDSNQPGASNAMAVLVDVRVRVKRLVDAVVYCLLSLIDGHTLAKTSVLERIEDIIDCIEVTSPKNLADRALIRLICSYAHQGARELCEGGEHSCIEDALFENQDLGAIERFRRIATASSTSPAKAAQTSAKAGASIAPGLQRLQASLLVLKTFAEAVTAQEKARRDEAGGRLKEELEEQKKRIGLVSITAYKALAHWTKRSDRPREEARLLRSPKPAIEHVLNTLVLDEFFELRMEQERIALLLLLRGDPLKIDKDDGGDDAESEDDEEEKKSEAGDHVAVEIEDEPFLKEATPSKRPRAAKAPAKEVELAPAPAKKAAKSAAADVEPALAKKGTGEATPPHGHREDPRAVPQTDSTSTFIATDNPYSVFSPQERKVQFLLDVRRAVARTVLDDVLEGNVVMAFIMLLVIGTILYEQVLGLMYGLSNGFVDTYVFLIMWIFTAELGEETYKLAMTLLNTGNKEIYDAFQACARSNSAEKQFFAERVIWDRDGLRCRGSRPRRTTDVERYERAETEARGSSPRRPSALLIQHAIETSTKKACRRRRPRSTRRAALMGLRYGQLNAVLVAALGMLSVLMTDSISKMLDACTDGVNFATVVTPNEPELTQLSQWSTEGKIYFVSLSVGFMNFWIAVYMRATWSGTSGATRTKTLKRRAS
ncbi:cellulose 1,4-beta-cellobiosidase [Aureococcus anophagefferens]|nr:cellulose 1,4-beta-cellobiosidase [Aureococcus anophagefferens]